MRSRGLAPLLAVAAALGVALLAAGVYLMLQSPRLAVDDVGRVPAAGPGRAAPAKQLQPAPGPPGAPAPSGPPTAVPSPAAPPAAIPPQPPATLRVPAAGLVADVLPVGVEPSGALQLPENPALVGWWAAGALPGSEQGAVVLAGHVDSARLGVGVLKHLVDLPLPADVQVVDTAGDVVPYRLVARRVFEKSALPPEIFRQDGAPQLVVVTCGGPFNARTGHYADNVVLYAVPGG